MSRGAGLHGGGAKPGTQSRYAPDNTACFRTGKQEGVFNMAAPISRTCSLFAISAALGQFYAQSTQGAEAQPANTTADMLQEVVVTAERRAENVQTTPIAITALSAEAIANKGVRDQTDLQFASPSLSMTQVGFTENVNIRGIGINLQSPVVVSAWRCIVTGSFIPATSWPMSRTTISPTSKSYGG